MRVTQGMFSFLPDLTDTQIEAQVTYFIDEVCAVAIEHTDDPHPRNTYWEMWGQPYFDLGVARPVMEALADCRDEVAHGYIRIVAFDATKGWESLRGSFIVQRPADEPGYHLERSYRGGRSVQYTTRSYATDRPAGTRYR